MPETLYRKYRPQTFSDVVDQQHVRITLQHALVQKRVAHAYLFAGPRGIGKTTLARILARAVNCQQPTQAGEPCNKCPTCLAMTDGRMLDFIEIDAASQTGVENVRENVIQSARSVPSLGRYKVFVIDEVHMLSLPAFNALLKLLEEPPAHAIFILATTEVHRVPDTIISRTQRFDFRRLSAGDMAHRLRQLAAQEKRKLEEGVAERIARFAGGSMRDAESMLGQLFSFQDQRITNDIADLVLPRSNSEVVLRIIAALVRRQATEALDHFHAFCDEGGDIPTLVHDLVLASRSLMLSSIDPKLLEAAEPGQSSDHLSELLELVKLGSTPTFLGMVDELLMAERQLYRGALLELPVEIAIVKITQPKDSADASPPPPAKNRVSAPRPAPKAGLPKTGRLTLEAAQRAWTRVRNDLSRENPSLRISLQQAEITAAEGREVRLGVPYDLHRQRLQSAPVHSRLVKDLQRDLGHDLTLTIVSSEPSSASAPSSPAAGPAKSQAPDKSGDPWEQVVASFES